MTREEIERIGREELTRIGGQATARFHELTLAIVKYEAKKRAGDPSAERVLGFLNDQMKATPSLFGIKGENAALRAADFFGKWAARVLL